MANLSDWINELKTDADAANEVARELRSRDVEAMHDVDWLTPAVIEKLGHDGSPQDSGRDTRSVWQAVAAATWLRNGGTRFCPSDSVAASLILTRQQPGAIHLPYPTQLIHLPVGFMPSPVIGEYEGMILVARLTESKIYTISCTSRGGSYATRVLIFDDVVDESNVAPYLAETDRPSPWGALPWGALADVREPIPATSPEASNNAVAMTIRIIRNFASWISAFPIRPSTDRRASITSGEVGGSVSIGPMVYLKTEVQMAPEMRAAAKALVRMDANYEVRKMAMRHIVRGHWKRQVTKDGRKTIFVAPYWRGPDGPAAWGRVYKMHESETLS